MTVEAWIAFASLVGTMLGGYAAIKADLALTRERPHMAQAQHPATFVPIRSPA